MADWRFQDVEFVFREWTLRPEDEAFLRHRLDRVRQESAAMFEVRRLVRERTGAEVDRLSDEQALAQFARFFVIRRDVPEPLRQSEGGAAAAPPAAAQPAPPPRTAPPREREPEPATFPPNHSPSAQADALVAAAATGVPFCEECARAAAGRPAGVR